MTEVRVARRVPAAPVFVTGSLLRHILVMTGAGAIGLMAIFLGDLANIYFLSRLGDEAIVAAVGYASTIGFGATSIGIGLSIAATSLVSPALGAGRWVRARRLSAHSHVLAFVVATAASLAMWFTIGPLLAVLGATGRTFDLAVFYLKILVPTLPLLSLGMTSAAVLRSVGDPRRAMQVTLYGAIINTALDVAFIAYLGLGIAGAAYASLLARLAIAAVGLYGVIGVHGVMARPKLATLRFDAPPFLKVAGPAVLTNLAPAAGNGYVTYAMSAYGDAAVAAWAIIARITPVAFGVIYALSGTIGPILGQNLGARFPLRVRDAYTLSISSMAAFTFAAWIVLALTADGLANLFNAAPETHELIVFFCRWLALLFIFLGALFVSSAVFNTLGRAHVATALNWGRATLGTIPFVLVGGHAYGAKGVLAGNMVGGVIFGIVAVAAGYRLIGGLAQRLDA